MLVRGAKNKVSMSVMLLSNLRTGGRSIAFVVLLPETGLEAASSADLHQTETQLTCSHRFCVATFSICEIRPSRLLAMLDVIHQYGRQHADQMTRCEAACFGGQVVQGG